MMTRKTQQANSLPVLYEGNTVRTVQVWAFYPDYREGAASQLVATLDNQGGVTLQEMSSGAGSASLVFLDDSQLGQLLAAREAYRVEIGGWHGERNPFLDYGTDETDGGDYPY